MPQTIHATKVSGDETKLVLPLGYSAQFGNLTVFFPPILKHEIRLAGGQEIPYFNPKVKKEFPGHEVLNLLYFFNASHELP